MFEKFLFTVKQVDAYYASALRDLKIALNSDVPEVAFRFSYDAIIKLSIALCAANGLRVKSRAGHHAALIGKLGEYLDREYAAVADDMRIKRNRDIYGGGVRVTMTQSREYAAWAKTVFINAHKYLRDNLGKML